MKCVAMKVLARVLFLLSLGRKRTGLTGCNINKTN